VWTGGPERPASANAELLVRDELGLASVARFAVVMPAVYYLAQLINVRVNAAAFRTAGHQVRAAYDAAQAGRTVPTYHVPSLTNPLTVIVGLATVAAVVVACIWQYRAATAARALGFPSRRSPGWGVGAWFVPIVNFWVPYGAIRDCLPAGDPQRARVLRWWLAWVIGVALNFVAFWSAFFSTGVALAFSIPAAIALLAVVAWAPRIVMSIAAAHSRATPGLGQSTGGVLS